MVALGEVLEEAQPGFACGEEDAAGIFQFRMHNVTKEGSLDLAKRRRVPPGVHRQIDRFFVDVGDVLFNATNSPDGVGKSILIGPLDEPAVFSNHFLRLRTDGNHLDPGYLARWLHAQFTKGVFRGMARQWVNQAAIDRARLLQMKLPLPPLAEQRRIAAILDQADALRAKRRQSIALLDDLARSAFDEQFRSWPTSEKVGNVAIAIRTGPFGSQLLHGEFVDTGIAVLGLDNVVNNEFRWVGRRYITPLKYSQLKRYTVHPGDVLISIMGTTGRCVVVPEGIPLAINSKHICAITLGSGRLTPSFLRAAFLWHPTSRAHLQRQTKGSIMDGLNMGIIRAMPIPVPPLELQREYDALVTGIEARRKVARQGLDTLDELFATLQAQAFSGQL